MLSMLERSVRERTPSKPGWSMHVAAAVAKVVAKAVTQSKICQRSPHWQVQINSMSLQLNLRRRQRRRRLHIPLLHQRRRYQRQLVAHQRHQKGPVRFRGANLRLQNVYQDYVIIWGGMHSAHTIRKS